MYDRYLEYADISYWEFVLSFFYVAILYIYFARQKNLHVKRAPEYRFFLMGLLARVLGGVAYALVYTYYYDGGDTKGYFYSAATISNLFFEYPDRFFRVVFSGNDPSILELFTTSSGRPFRYMHADARTWMVIRLLAPICLVTFNSYMVLSVVLGSLSYFGVWRCYRTMVGYFPTLDRQFAVGFLFMPSVIFWGSGVVKDTFTFSAMCWFIHLVDRWFHKGESGPWLIVGAVTAAGLLISIKPYIFMALMPAMVAWVYYERISRIRNSLIKYAVLPVGVLCMLAASLFILQVLGDKLDKFSLDQALATIVVSKEDMTQAHAYGNNYFDVGELDESWASVLRASPVAVNAALFRPYLWESRNIVMVAAGLENLWLLLLALTTVAMGHVVKAFRMLVGNPLALMCMAFSLVFAFVVGISTPNFGALVRFKIPLVPLFASGLFIVRFLLQRSRRSMDRGQKFDVRDYIHGDPSPEAVARRRNAAIKAKR